MSKDRLKYQESKCPIAMLPVAIFFKIGGAYKVVRAYDYKDAKKAVNALKKGKMPQIRYQDVNA